MSQSETHAPPVGEEIHLPGPSLIPLVNALGLSLAIVGLTISYLVTAVGVFIFLVTTVRWVLDTRHDMAELPPEHH